MRSLDQPQEYSLAESLLPAYNQSAQRNIKIGGRIFF